MNTHPISAVIVTFHPNEGMIANLREIVAQVQEVVVVDNGSRADILDMLRMASRTFGFQLIENADNLGIAEALNQGVRWAKSKGFPWVIFFDQDSKITDGFVDQMFNSWESHPYRERVCSIHPRYLDPNCGTHLGVRFAKDGGPITSMTSGAMMPVWIFDKIGYFASEYFIDWVDIEYCLRMRAAGYLIAESQYAVLKHSAGHPQMVTFAGFRFWPTHHSPIRRYYISRNRIAVYRKYFRVFPAWTLHLVYESLRETAKCFLGERDRAHKFRNFVLGTRDGLAGRMGKREGL